MGAPTDRELIVLVGTNGTGKTWEMEKLLQMNERNLIIPPNKHEEAWHKYPELYWKRQRVEDTVAGKKYMVAEIPELETFQGNKKITLYGEYKDLIWQRIITEDRPFTHGGLFIDDLSKRIQYGRRLTEDENDLFSDKRHRRIDIITSVHSFQKLNPAIWDHTPTFMVKYTSRPPTKDLKNRVHNLEELTEKVQRVNAIALGKHPQYAKNPFYYEWYTPEMKLGEV